MSIDINTLIDKGALFVVSHSGGKDSQAMMIYLRHLGVPVDQMIVVHACLGKIEWEGALELAQKNAESANVPFIVAKSKRTLFDMVEDRHKKRPEVPSWPSSANRQCTSDLKRGPITREARRYATEHGFHVVVNCMGFRGEESPARRKRKRLTRVARNCTQAREWFDFLPIQDWPAARVFQTIHDDGQEPHWAYGEGNDRLSCVFCIFGSENDLRNGARHRPSLAQEYIKLEKKTGYTMHQSRKPLEELVA